MSFGDYTAAPEPAEERELRELREQNAAIRREVGADESRCVSQYRGRAGIGPLCGEPPDRHCDIEIPSPDKHGCDKWHHKFQPESTLAAVQRMAKERMSDDACADFRDRLSQPLQVILSEGGNIVTLLARSSLSHEEGDDIAQSARAIISNAKRAHEVAGAIGRVRGTPYVVGESLLRSPVKVTITEEDRRRPIPNKTPRGGA